MNKFIQYRNFFTASRQIPLSNGKNINPSKFVVIRLEPDTTSTTIGEYSNESEAVAKCSSLACHAEKYSLGTQFYIKHEDVKSVAYRKSWEK
eukprot:gene6175-10182_t